MTNVIEKVKSKDFSIDAEGKLRIKISDNYFGHDVLNKREVRTYLQSAGKLLR